MIEIVYTWPDGREEVRYRRANVEQARDLIEACHRLRGLHGDSSPYSYRNIDKDWLTRARAAVKEKRRGSSGQPGEKHGQ